MREPKKQLVRSRKQGKKKKSYKILKFEIVFTNTFRKSICIGIKFFFFFFSVNHSNTLPQYIQNKKSIRVRTRNAFMEYIFYV